MNTNWLLSLLCLIHSIDAKCIDKTFSESISYSTGDWTYSYNNAYNASLKISLIKSSVQVSAELFVGFGYQPTDYTDQCGYSGGENTEYCYFNPSEVGTYDIMVAVHQTPSYDVTITIVHDGNCSSITPSPTPLQTSNVNTTTTINSADTTTTIGNNPTINNHKSNNSLIIIILTILITLIVLGIILLIICYHKKRRKKGDKRLELIQNNCDNTNCYDYWMSSSFQ